MSAPSKAKSFGPHVANGQIIRDRRLKRKLKQAELGDAVGISRSQILKLEKGVHLPSPETRDRLETTLGLKPGTVQAEEASVQKAPFRTGSADGSVRRASTGRRGKTAGSAGKAHGVAA